MTVRPLRCNWQRCENLQQCFSERIRPKLSHSFKSYSVSARNAIKIYFQIRAFLLFVLEMLVCSA